MSFAKKPCTVSQSDETEINQNIWGNSKCTRHGSCSLVTPWFDTGEFLTCHVFVSWIETILQYMTVFYGDLLVIPKSRWNFPKITLDYPRATDARDEDDVDKESAIEEVSIAYIVAMALYAVTVGVAQQDLDFTDVASDRMRV